MNLKVSPSSLAFPGFISKIPLNGYGCPPYANSTFGKQNVRETGGGVSSLSRPQVWWFNMDPGRPLFHA